MSIILVVDCGLDCSCSIETVAFEPECRVQIGIRCDCAVG